MERSVSGSLLHLELRGLTPDLKTERAGMPTPLLEDNLFVGNPLAKAIAMLVADSYKC